MQYVLSDVNAGLADYQQQFTAAQQMLEELWYRALCLPAYTPDLRADSSFYV
jgi:hypothetical protein